MIGTSNSRVAAWRRNNSLIGTWSRGFSFFLYHCCCAIDLHQGRQCDSSPVLPIGTGDLIRVMRSAADRTCIPDLNIGNTGTLDKIPLHDSTWCSARDERLCARAWSVRPKASREDWLMAGLPAVIRHKATGHLVRDTVMVCPGHSLLQQVTSTSLDKLFLGNSVTRDTAITPEHASGIKRLRHSATLNLSILHKLL